MTRAMRRWAAAALISAAVAGISPSGATEIGIRYGRADLRGNRLFPGGGDLDATPLIGLQVEIEALSFLGIEIAGESYSEDFRFEDGRFGDVAAEGTGTFKDLALLVTGKIGIPIHLILPLGIYGGAGLSAHFLDVDLDATPVEGSGLAPDKDLEEAVQDVAGERTEVEWHAVVGLKIGLPALPLVLFGEARYQDILDSHTPDLGSAYLGLNLRFQ